MKKQIIFLVLLPLLLLFTGCQHNYINSKAMQTAEVNNSDDMSVPSETQYPEMSETPSASGADKTKPATNSLFSHSIMQNGTAVTISLGMTLGEVTELLDKAGITYSEGDHWADTEPGEKVSGISLTESITCEYLNFSEGGTLDYIQWALAADSIAGGDESAFPGCVASAIETYGFLPLYYHFESGNEAVLFPLEGGYYMQFHDTGEVTGVLSYDNQLASGKPSKDYALLLSAEASYGASEDYVDIETVLTDVSEKYGETDTGGNNNTYTLEGIALYDQRLYYSIRWATISEDAGASSYNEQIYVSLDGNTSLRGYHNEVLLN